MSSHSSRSMRGDSVNKNRRNIRFIVISGVISALYIVLTLPMAQLAFGPIQLRLAEVLTVLPAFGTVGIPGVTIGCFLSNLLNPGALGPIDILGGTCATLISALLSRFLGKYNKYLGVVPPIVINGIIVGGYLPFIIYEAGTKVTPVAVLISMLSVAASEAVILIILGIPLIAVINRNRKLNEKLKDF
ncbi:MAG: QueT transporter family protein [Clostridia bacterium]|nr:QueT transporter family protein [Clostridia bacterium]